MPPVEEGPPGGNRHPPADKGRQGANGHWQFVRSFASEPAAIRDVLVAVKSFLMEQAPLPRRHDDGSGARGDGRMSRKAKPVPQRISPAAGEVVGRVGLVLAETLNNVAEHAYAARPGGEVTLRLRASKDDVLVQIVDRGQAMPENRLPDGNLPRADVCLDDLPEGGFGWYLIHSQADSIRYERVGDENRLLLLFMLRGVQ